MEKLIVSSSPHIRTKVTTKVIMRDVLIALTPAAVASVVLFGLSALLVIAVCVASSVLFEFLFNLLVKKEQTVSDLSAAVTGLLLAFSLPANAEIYHCIVGSFFAIVIVKCLFGGIGCNFANPAVASRVLLLIAFSSSVGDKVATNFMDPELVGGATPLEAIKSGATDSLPSLIDMLVGNRMGALGETCAIALIVGGVYLILRRVIKWQIPVIYIGTVFVLSFIIKMDFNLALYEVLGGGVVIAAFFMITDYVTTPTNTLGKMVFALGAALITVLIRFFGSYPEGVSFAILIMNILSPYVERLCSRKPFGKVGKK
ncbi:MAG: RnfABCDGE type electron transport complex subunit D [Clostridia bacterium]|nr:RnfABCDGE type electron transport complex subunit D [Clostridia bacterium]